MAPNLVNKPISTRGKSESLTAVNGATKITSKSSSVRTKFIINNIYVYLFNEECDLIPIILPLNSTEVKTLEAFKSVVDEFRLHYSDTISALGSCLPFNSETETVRCAFLGVASELFSGGINWSAVATFFVFAGEVAIQILRRNLPESLVEDILDCFIEFVQNNLEKWIFDHGGWEGIIEFSNGRKKNDDIQAPTITANSRNSGWGRSVLHGTVRVLGTLAQIANSTGPSMSFPMRMS